MTLLTEPIKWHEGKIVGQARFKEQQALPNMNLIDRGSPSFKQITNLLDSNQLSVVSPVTPGSFVELTSRPQNHSSILPIPIKCTCTAVRRFV